MPHQEVCLEACLAESDGCTYFRVVETSFTLVYLPDFGGFEKCWWISHKAWRLRRASRGYSRGTRIFHLETNFDFDVCLPAGYVTSLSARVGFDRRNQGSRLVPRSRRRKF